MNNAGSSKSAPAFGVFTITHSKSEQQTDTEHIKYNEAAPQPEYELEIDKGILVIEVMTPLPEIPGNTLTKKLEKKLIWIEAAKLVWQVGNFVYYNALKPEYLKAEKAFQHIATEVEKTSPHYNYMRFTGILGANTDNISSNSTTGEATTPPTIQETGSSGAGNSIKTGIDYVTSSETTSTSILDTVIPPVPEEPTDYVTISGAEASSGDLNLDPSYFNSSHPKFVSNANVAHYVNMDRLSRLDAAWKEFGTTHWDGLEATAEGFKEIFKKYGFEVEETKEGLEITEIINDPLGIAAQLHMRGIEDKALIQRAVNEGDRAIAQMESFLQQLQSGLSTFNIEQYKPKQSNNADTAQAEQANSTNAENDSPKDATTDLLDLLNRLFSEYNPFVPANLSQPSLQQPTLPDATIISPGSGLTTETTTPLGLHIQASITTDVVKADSDLPLGFHATPLLSMSAAKLRQLEQTKYL